MGGSFAPSSYFFQTDDMPTVEVVRMWCVLIICIAMQILSWLAAHRLYRTNRTLTFDCVVLICESMRVLLLLVYEFVFDHLIVLMAVFLVETILRSVVCANFVSRAILLRRHINNQKHIRCFMILYYTFVFSVVAVLLIMSMFSSSKISCNNDIYSYHWFIVDVLDLLQSLLITISAVFLVRHLRRQLHE